MPTALHIASNRVECVRMFLEAGADTDAANASAEAALYFAAECGHWEIVQILLKAGADKDAAN